MLKYEWRVTDRSKQLLIELEAVKLVFDDLQTKPHHEANLRQISLLKSSVFSARIEGFTDTVISPKKEGQNLLSAYRLVHSDRAPKTISLNIIRRLHLLTLKNISSTAGNWRSQPWAIFNQSGVAIYLAPPHFEIPKLMGEYIVYIRQLSEHQAIKAAVAQFIFEKIHPFADGNGRVGRLISAFILKNNGYGFRGIAPFEEYIDINREDYYLHLEPSRDCTAFVEFFLEAIVSESRKIIGNLNNGDQDRPENVLSLRRQEIISIIRDHPNCSFDFLRRRFAAVNIKTLHYDLAQLAKKGFIKKLGATRGVVYATK